jgi:hypothetical protein
LTDIAVLHPSFGVSPCVIDAAGRLPVDGTGFSSSISAQTWCAGHLRADEPALVRAGAEFEDGRLIERHNESRGDAHAA